MNSMNVAEAKAHFSEVVAQAEAGETICITRRGKPVATVTAAETPRRPIDLNELRALTGCMPSQAEGAGDFMRRLRDESRY